MDGALVAWARAVKSRGLGRGQRRGPGLPVLWLFTDARYLPDPLPAIGRLPPGSGVVFRHDGPGVEACARAALGRRVAALCRARRIVLVVAGDWRLAAALGAGVHHRGGDGRPRAGGRVSTASAHNGRELAAAVRLGALVFLSPAFPSRSHPGAPGLGPVRWAALARRARVPVLALGGVDGVTCRRLPRDHCAGAGAISALS